MAALPLHLIGLSDQTENVIFRGVSEQDWYSVSTDQNGLRGGGNRPRWLSNFSDVLSE